MRWPKSRVGKLVRGVTIAWTILLLCGLVKYEIFMFKVYRAMGPGPRDIPKSIEGDYLDGLYESWEGGKVLYRKRVDVVGHPIVFDIVDTQNQVEFGFAPITLPVTDLFVNVDDQIHIYLATIKLEKCFFVTIGPNATAVRLE